MATHDLVHQVDTLQCLVPAARTASANGTAVDTAEGESVLFLFEFGTITDGTHTPKLQDSPDNSTWTDVAAAGLLDNNMAAVNSSGGGSTVQKVGYIGAQRYVRPVLTVASATTGGLSSCIAVVGGIHHLPKS